VQMDSLFFSSIFRAAVVAGEIRLFFSSFHYWKKKKKK
jgi:hypothetical protein